METFVNSYNESHFHAPVAQLRVKKTLHKMAGALAEDGRSYKGLDKEACLLYVTDCFLKSLFESVYKNHFILTGDHVFRVWNVINGFCPTSYLTLHCSEDIKLEDFKKAMISLISNRQFCQETGLMFDQGSLRIDSKNSSGQTSYCLKSKVAFIGHNNTSSMEIPFIFDVRCGPILNNSYETIRWTPPTMDQPFDIVVSRPELIASEKFGLIACQDLKIVNLKDIRDLSIALQRPDFNHLLFKNLISHMYSIHNSRPPFSESITSIPVLFPSYASLSRENQWQTDKWPEWEGRDFNASKDMSLRESLSVLTVEFERHGIFLPSSALDVTSLLSSLCKLSSQVRLEGVVRPIIFSRFSSILKELTTRLPASDLMQVAWRWEGMARKSGVPGMDIHTAYLRCQDIVTAFKLEAALERGWNSGRGGSQHALVEISKRLKHGVEILQQQKNKLNPIEEKQPNLASVRSKKVVSKGDSEVGNALYLLAEGKPGTHPWFMGLARVLSSQDTLSAEASEVKIEMPLDPRAALLWMVIANKFNVPIDLSEAIEVAQEKLSSSGIQMRF
jgi:hypothetical protein